MNEPIARKTSMPTYAKRTQNHSYRTRGTKRTLTHYNPRTPIGPPRTTTYPTMEVR